jgi:hypothetical protein
MDHCPLLFFDANENIKHNLTTPICEAATK